MTRDLRLGTVTTRLAAFRKHWETAFDRPHTSQSAPGASSLTETTGFGSNPGSLRMLSCRPPETPPRPALVVVLHGCTQSAAGYDHGAGWSALASRHGFVVLCPEQPQANNPKRCFNWFLPADAQRDVGEAMSIRQMIGHAVAEHNVDPARIFVTGLSAGGAMANVMLAAYPEVFAGGAIMAGLPFGTASNVAEAFESMFKGRVRPADQWGDLVRAASIHRGPWPRVSVWHGSADTTVLPVNAAEIVKQWTNVHGLEAATASSDAIAGFPRQTWRDQSGAAVVESITITGMGHGTPLAVSGEAEPIGSAGPFLLDVGLASSLQIARFWGLTDDGVEMRAPAETAKEASPRNTIPFPSRPKPRERPPDRPASRIPTPNDVEGVIRRALRSAGLLR